MRAKNLFKLADYSAIAARDESDFSDHGEVTSFGSFEGATYTFKDNGANVLGVAHLDTVQGGTDCSLIKIRKEPILFSPRLDDRLGVYIITSLLPKMGITCDWLLTTGEEVGQSSAEYFKPAKTYNWAFSFDRAGVDCVLYHYDHKALRRILRKAGFVVGHGTFSDLSFLDAGCSGINFGCGYADAHSRHAHAFLNDTFKMVDLFARFHKRYSLTRLPYKPAARWERFPRYSNLGYQPYWPESEWETMTAEERAYFDWARPYDDWQTYQSKLDRALDAQYRQELDETLNIGEN